MQTKARYSLHSFPLEMTRESKTTIGFVAPDQHHPYPPHMGVCVSRLAEVAFMTLPILSCIQDGGNHDLAIFVDKHYSGLLNKDLRILLGPNPLHRQSPYS